MTIEEKINQLVCRALRELENALNSENSVTREHTAIDILENFRHSCEHQEYIEPEDNTWADEIEIKNNTDGDTL